MPDDRMTDVKNILNIGEAFEDLIGSDDVVTLEENNQDKIAMLFKSDFNTIRKNMLKSINELGEIIKELKNSMKNVSEDKTAPRKAETIALLARTKLDYMKSLTDMYKKRNDILGNKPTANKENDDENSKMTLQEILNVMDGETINNKKGIEHQVF